MDGRLCTRSPRLVAFITNLSPSTASDSYLTRGINEGVRCLTSERLCIDDKKETPLQSEGRRCVS
jgi:hypothetical protein